MTSPRRNRTELAMAGRVARAQQRRRLVAVADVELDTLPIPRPFTPAEVAAIRRQGHRTRAALRSASILAGAVALFYYAVPTGAALGWWGS